MTGKTPACRTDLDGHVAIVTGGSSGLGHAIALALAEAGSTVALVSRRREAGERAGARITSRTGRAASALACDVSDEAGVHRAAGEVAERFGRLDILVTSAGIQARGDVGELGAAQLRRCLEINVVGTFLACQAAVPFMRAAARRLDQDHPQRRRAPALARLPGARHAQGGRRLPPGRGRRAAPAGPPERRRPGGVDARPGFPRRRPVRAVGVRLGHRARHRPAGLPHRHPGPRGGPLPSGTCWSSARAPWPWSTRCCSGRDHPGADRRRPADLGQPVGRRQAAVPGHAHRYHRIG